MWQVLQRKAGNEESREGHSRLNRVNPVVDGVTGKNKKLRERDDFKKLVTELEKTLAPKPEK